jgi:hypothetical protein
MEKPPEANEKEETGGETLSPVGLQVKQGV